MSEQITSEILELTAPRLAYSVRFYEGGLSSIEWQANEDLGELEEAGWTLASANLTERSTGGFALMLWFEREVQP